jgi:glycosyltransferase involved in cell wall biosynthesis
VLASVDAKNDVVDVIANSGAGIVVLAEDPAAIATGCERFLAMTPEELSEMGARGRRYVEEHHSPEAAAQQFLTLWGANAAAG